MKKIVYSFLMFAITISGASMVSADQLKIPTVYHYGNTAYSQINITNLASMAVQLSVQFDASTTKSASARTNTGGSTNKTATLAAGQTWTVLTKDADVYGSTTSLKRVNVTIQTSATDNPFVGSNAASIESYTTASSRLDTSAAGGQVVANAMFIYVNSGTPTGFQFPVFHRVRTWTSGDGTLGTSILATGTTADGWEQ